MTVGERGENFFWGGHIEPERELELPEAWSSRQWRCRSPDLAETAGSHEQPLIFFSPFPWRTRARTTLAQRCLSLKSPASPRAQTRLSPDVLPPIQPGKTAAVQNRVHTRLDRGRPPSGRAGPEHPVQATPLSRTRARRRASGHWRRARGTRIRALRLQESPGSR